jgi:heptosyltransferase-2
MSSHPLIHFDCIKFLGELPCKPNKEFGVFCDNCLYYERDESIKINFPDINPAPEHFPSDEFKKIIIVKLDAVGDVLRTTSILRGLKKIYGNSEITWITKSNAYEVLKDNQLIDKIFFTADNLEDIYNNTYDISINLDSGFASCEIMQNIKANISYGYTIVNKKPYPINSAAINWYLMGINDNFKKLNNKTYHKLIYEICNLNYDNEQPIINFIPEMQQRSDEISQNISFDKFKQLILINLGGGNRWQFKKWTPVGYYNLTKILSNKYTDSAIGIIAGEEDREFYNNIEEQLKKLDRNNIIYFGTENSLSDFISIIALANKVFTSDSLCFHIAQALGKYVVVFTGPTSYSELDVFGSGKIIYSDKVNCLCCYLNKCDKTVNCMNTLEAEAIAELF